MSAEALEKRLPKFRSDDDIHIVVAGADAGKFSGAFQRLGDRRNWLDAGVAQNRKNYKLDDKEGVMMTILLDPTNERIPVARSIAPRPAAITGECWFFWIFPSLEGTC